MAEYKFDGDRILRDYMLGAGIGCGKIEVWQELSYQQSK